MADTVYRLVLRATFESPEELDRAVTGLQKLKLEGANVGVTIGQAGRTSQTSLESIARSGMQVGFMFNMLESAYMRQAMAMMLATNSQERYNTVVARYGANSREAQEAAKEMQMQMEYLNLANMRANVSMALMATQFAISTGLLKAETWATVQATASKTAHAIATKLEAAAHSGATLSLIAHKAATAAATVVDWLHVAALKAKVILLNMVSMGTLTPAILAAGAVATAAVAGYTLAGSKQKGGYIPETGAYLLHKGEYVIPTNSTTTITHTTVPTTQFNFETHIHVEADLDAALREQNRRIKNEYRSLTS